MDKYAECYYRLPGVNFFLNIDQPEHSFHGISPPE